MRKAIIAGALALTMVAGSASAWPVLGSTGNWSGSIDKVIGGTATTWVGGTLAAWTVYRFFQNCGPFTCN